MRLRESEERYRALSELMSDYAFFIRVEDGKQSLEWMTDSFERLTGYHADEVFPGKTAKLFHADDVPKLAADVASVMEGKETISEVRMVTKEGEPRTLIYRRRPVWDEEKTAIIGYYTVAEDITARKLTEAQERRLQAEEEQLRMVRQFMLAISHDFRTLLATIETSRYLVERALPPDVREGVQPRLDRIHASVNHISTQLNNLQLVTSITNLRVFPTNLTALLEEICHRHSDAAQDTEVQLRFTAESDLGTVLLDHDKIRTAVEHLVRNALTNTSAGGTIELRTRHDKDNLFIQVQDTGRGIAPKDLPHIFEAFYRSDEARQVDLGGLGLGLTLVKMIVDGHEGQIKVKSEPGHGTCFEIQLPHLRPN
jgi:PAS domain S-box-containing protein